MFALRNSPLALIALAFLILLAGCGGDGSSSETSAQTLSKAKVIKQGDAICARVDKNKAGEFFEWAKENPKAAKTRDGEAELIATVAVPVLERELVELQGLAPTSDVKSYEEILEAFETALEEIRAEPISVIFRKTSPLVRPNKLASDFGFKEPCSNLF